MPIRSAGKNLFVSLAVAFLASFGIAGASNGTEHYRCDWIVLARYDGSDAVNSPNFGTPIAAYFHVDKVFKGPPCGSRLVIRYDHNQKTSGTGDSENRFLPEKGSQWLLFIPVAMTKHGMYETFEGSKGRIRSSAVTLHKALELEDRPRENGWENLLKDLIEADGS